MAFHGLKVGKVEKVEELPRDAKGLDVDME